MWASARVREAGGASLMFLWTAGHCSNLLPSAMLPTQNNDIVAPAPNSCFNCQLQYSVTVLLTLKQDLNSVFACHQENDTFSNASDWMIDHSWCIVTCLTG